MMSKKLVIYDFDGTLFRSLDEVEGKRLYMEKTGLSWPYRGWWGCLESLMPPLVPLLPGSEWYFSDVVSAQKNDDGYLVLMTGRLGVFKERIMELLKVGGMSFDEIYFGVSGVNTFVMKTERIKEILGRGDYSVLEIWEDRVEHIDGFTSLCRELKGHLIEMAFVHDVLRKKVIDI